MYDAYRFALNGTVFRYIVERFFENFVVEIRVIALRIEVTRCEVRKVRTSRSIAPVNDRTVSRIRKSHSDGYGKPMESATENKPPVQEIARVRVKR